MVIKLKRHWIESERKIINERVKIQWLHREARYKLQYVFSNSSIDNNDFVCAICGKQPIEKHHENYALWYSFIPLCKRCHGLTRGKKGKQTRLKRLVAECQNVKQRRKVYKPTSL